MVPFNQTASWYYSSRQSIRVSMLWLLSPSHIPQKPIHDHFSSKNRRLVRPGSVTDVNQCVPGKVHAQAPSVNMGDRTLTFDAGGA